MLVENVSIERIENSRLEVKAVCGGEDLYFRFPGARFRQEGVGDAILLSTLLPAMVGGSDVKIPHEFPVSSRLAKNLDWIQEVWKSWNSNLKKVSVDAAYYDPDAVGSGVGLFYAGGIDSAYSLCVHQEEVEVLICCYGFDFGFTPETIQKSIARNGKVAEKLGRELIPVESNHSQFVRKFGISRTYGFAAALSAIAHMLGLERCYIASTHSVANLRPDGSHPSIDCFFSNGVTEIIHDHNVSRFTKTVEVAKHPPLLENLRVCWNSHEDNCGYCSKCVRTMVALQLVGAAGPFPPLKDKKQLIKMAADTEMEFVIELVVAAHEKGDKEIVQLLKKGLRASDRKEMLKSLDNALFGGKLRKRLSQMTDPDVDLITWNLRPDLEIS